MYIYCVKRAHTVICLVFPACVFMRMCIPFMSKQSSLDLPFCVYQKGTIFCLMHCTVIPVRSVCVCPMHCAPCPHADCWSAVQYSEDLVLRSLNLNVLPL